MYLCNFEILQGQACDGDKYVTGLWCDDNDLDL